MSLLSRFAAIALIVTLPAAAHAASCSDTGGQYEGWKAEMAAEAVDTGKAKELLERLAERTHR